MKHKLTGSGGSCFLQAPIIVGAPSARLQPNGTENRSFAGVCLGYMLMPFVSKAVFGERPSKARSLDFMGYDSQAWHAWKFT